MNNFHARLFQRQTVRRSALALSVPYPPYHRLRRGSSLNGLMDPWFGGWIMAARLAATIYHLGVRYFEPAARRGKPYVVS